MPAHLALALFGLLTGDGRVRGTPDSMMLKRISYHLAFEGIVSALSRQLAPHFATLRSSG